MTASRRYSALFSALGLLLLLLPAAAENQDEPDAALAVITFEPEDAEARQLERARTWLHDRPEPDTSDWSEKRVADYFALRRAHVPGQLPEGLLRIPAVDIELPIFAGTKERHLTLGAGRIEGTPPIGTGGNTGLAAHRDGFFRSLKDVQLGDSIYVESLDGQHEYRIDRLFVVDPHELYVLEPTGADTITIVTCYPFYYVGNAPERYIVRARKQ